MTSTKPNKRKAVSSELPQSLDEDLKKIKKSPLQNEKSATSDHVKRLAVEVKPTTSKDGKSTSQLNNIVELLSVAETVCLWMLV